jgi:integrase
MQVLKINMKVKDNLSTELLPIIFIEGKGPLASFVRYQKINASKSLSWKNKSAKALKLFLEYTFAMQNQFNNKTKLFGAFKRHLELGTVDIDGNDPTGLFWKPNREALINETIFHVTQFSDYLFIEAKKSGNDTNATLLNPYRKANQAEYMINLAAYHHRKNRSFLSHTYDKTKALASANLVREVTTRKQGRRNKDSKKFFPDEHITGLLNNFKLKGSKDSEPIEKRLNLKNILITILMHYGGLRVSEPFHLYMEDIRQTTLPNNKIIKTIRLADPSDSISPEKGFNNRRDYLNRKYGLLPRTEAINNKNYRSGWKGMLLDNDNEGIIHFYPSEIEDVFFKTLTLYLKHQRVRPKSENDHPFLFTDNQGNPASLPVFLKAHESAFNKLKLNIDYVKKNGVTPHGHRHAYGMRMTMDKVSNLTIQNCMHHKSLESQEDYKNPTPKMIRDELNAKSKKRKEPLKTIGLKPHNSFRDIDPLGLFSGRTDAY